MSELIFVAHAGADPNGAPLGVLTKAYDKKITVAARGAGEGSFVINSHDDQAAWCAPGNYVRVYLDDTEGDPVFAFWIGAGGDTLLDAADEEGGEVLARAGAGPLAYLAEAQVWHVAVSGGSAVVGGDGYWEWANRHPAAVMVRLLEEAQARGALPDLTWTFSRTLDSDGNPWSQGAADEFRLPIGLDLHEAASELLLTDFYLRMDHDLALHAWEQLGTDRSATIEFAKGVNIREAAERRIRDTPLSSHVLVQASRKDGDLKFRAVESAPVETLLGRRKETFLRYERTATNAVLDRVGQRHIQWLRRVFEGLPTIGVLDTPGLRALVDYHPGDVVAVNIPGAYDHEPIPVAAISLVETDGGEYDPILSLLDEPGPFGVGGGGGRGPANTDDHPSTGPTTADATLGYDECIPTTRKRNRVFHDDSHEYGTAAFYDLYSSVQPNTIWPLTDCGIGCGGWGPGREEREFIAELELASIPDDWLGVELRFAGYDGAYEGNSLGTPRGVADGGSQAFGVYFGEPTGVQGYVPLATAPLSGKFDLFVPRSMLRVGTNYIARAPAWHADAGVFFCDDDLASPCETPGEEGGEGNSGIIQVFNEPCAYPVLLASGGLTPWVPVKGDVDATNRTFELIGWTGDGVPQVRVGLVILGAGDFTYDSGAKTVTLGQAPAEGLDVRARYVAANP